MVNVLKTRSTLLCLLFSLLALSMLVDDVSAKKRKRRDDCIQLSTDDVTKYKPGTDFKKLDGNMYEGVKRFEGFYKDATGWRVTSGENLPNERHLVFHLGYRGLYENMFRVVKKGEKQRQWNNNWYWIDSQQTCYVDGTSMDEADAIHVHSYRAPGDDPLKAYPATQPQPQPETHDSSLVTPIL